MVVISVVEAIDEFVGGIGSTSAEKFWNIKLIHYLTLGRQRLHSLVLLKPFICTVDFTLYKYFQLKLSSDTEFLKLN